MQQVWMKRVAVKCEECECWQTKSDRDYAFEGTCHRLPPVVGEYGKGTWPKTQKGNGCFEGIKIEKEVLNEG